MEALLEVDTSLYDYSKVPYLPPIVNNNCIFEIDGLSMLDHKGKGFLEGMNRKGMPKIWKKSKTLIAKNLV